MIILIEYSQYMGVSNVKEPLGKRKDRMSFDTERKSQIPTETFVRAVSETWECIPTNVDASKIHHLALICDGHRRWANKNGLEPWEGDRVGMEVVLGLIRACKRWNIPQLTTWVWSTDNWRRTQAEVESAMELSAKYISSQAIHNFFLEEEVRFHHFGRKDRYPQSVADAIHELEAATAMFTEFQMNLGFDYGGLDEMTRAIYKIIELVQLGTFDPNELLVNPKVIFDFLENAISGNPELVIRTGVFKGGLPYTSGFMPMQASFSSWVFSEGLFPDLTPAMLAKYIELYSNDEKHKRTHYGK